MNKADTLPDVANAILQDQSHPLDWVGMEQIAVPITLQSTTAGNTTTLAKANIYVSLDDPSAKGIHMSRLHTILNKFGEEPCTKDTFDRLLDEVVDSQGGISSCAKIELCLDLLIDRPALLSDESGYQAYPVTINGELRENQRSYNVGITIPYSSTCPCSASLSRQLLANALDDRFETEKIDKETLLEWIQSEEGSVATPHAQRSYAYIKLTTGDNAWPELSELVSQLESVIGTPVQTAVKRVDEQEFARINGENLMFCEDAARRIKHFLEQMPGVVDYWLKVEHQESLHAHNAVVIDRK